MKLLVYDKFWDAFVKLNKKTQKNVLSFKKKFRENPKSAAIHLEPISTFRDQSLRTARIDQKYRAIIKVPETGDTYYLLWVDNHDEAMDWAKNKLFPWNEHTQSIQVFTAPEVIEKEVSKEATLVSKPLEQSVFSAYNDEKLTAIGVPEVLLPSVRKIADLEGLERLENYLPQDAFEHLFYLLDGANIDYLISEINEGKVDSETLIDQLNSPNNQRSFIELADDAMFNEVMEGHLDKWKYYLHPSQRTLVNKNFKGPVKVTGGAGTGKTVAALHRLKYLASLLPNGKSPILFTTFTHALTSNLKHQVSELKVSEKKVHIENIDALAFSLARRYKLMDENTRVFGLSAVKSPSDIWDDLLENELVEYDKDFLEREYEQVVLYHDIKELKEYLRIARTGRGKPISRRSRAALWSLFEKYKKAKRLIHTYHKEEVYNMVANYLKAHQEYPFSHGIVDELQDLSNVELRFIRALVEEKPNDLFFVGDPMQTIYNRKINFSKVGIHVRGKRSKRLRINYRTTEEIKKLAVSTIADCHYDNFDGEAEEKNGYISLRRGERPSYLLFKTKTEELDYIHSSIAQLAELGCAYSEIAIVCRTNDSVKEFQHYFHREKLPYYVLSGKKKTGDQKGIRLVTFHSIKGLEFKYVFIADVNSRTCPQIPYNFESKDEDFKADYLKSERSLLYVVISRAIEGVIISGIGNPSEWIML